MKALKVIGKIFAVLFCIVYFFVLLAFVTTFFATNFLKGDFYSNVITNIDLKNIKLSELDDVDFGIDMPEDATLNDVLVEALKRGGMEENVANKVMENKEIKELLGDVIGEYVSYSIIGGEAPVVTREDILVLANNKDITDAFGKPTDEEINNLVEQLNALLASESIPNNGGNETSKNIMEENYD